jgi:hypothetical protein
MTSIFDGFEQTDAERNAGLGHTEGSINLDFDEFRKSVQPLLTENDSANATQEIAVGKSLTSSHVVSDQDIVTTVDENKLADELQSLLGDCLV